MLKNTLDDLARTTVTTHVIGTTLMWDLTEWRLQKWKWMFTSLKRNEMPMLPQLARENWLKHADSMILPDFNYFPPSQSVGGARRLFHLLMRSKETGWIKVSLKNIFPVMENLLCDLAKKTIWTIIRFPRTAGADKYRSIQKTISLISSLE